MSFPASGVPSTLVTWQNAVTTDGEPLNALVEFSTTADLNFPSATPPTRFENPAVAEVVNGVMTSVILPDSKLSQGTAFVYTVTIKPEGGDVYENTTSLITGAEVDLSALGL